LVLKNLDTKSFLFKDIVLGVSGWQLKIGQGIKRLLPVVLALTGHPINVLKISLG
jgi:hypothetical protein